MTDEPRPFRKRWERVQRVVLTGDSSHLREMHDWLERNGYRYMKWQSEVTGSGDNVRVRIVGERPLDWHVAEQE